MLSNYSPLVIEATGADEILVTGHIYDHAARLRSSEIASEVHRIAVGSRAL